MDNLPPELADILLRLHRGDHVYGFELHLLAEHVSS